MTKNAFITTRMIVRMTSSAFTAWARHIPPHQLGGDV
jgi:hypothetical protein